MSVQKAMDEITSSEFLEWVVYLDDEPNQFNSQHQYLAQIAAEIRKMFAKNPGEVETENFIMRFIKKSEDKKMSKEEASIISKSKWFAGVGYKGKP